MIVRLTMIAFLILSALTVSADTETVLPNLGTQSTITTVQSFIDKDGVTWKVTCVETRTVTYAKMVPSPVPTPDPPVITPPTGPTPPTNPIPTTPPVVVPGSALSYRDSNGQVVTTIKNGDKLLIIGAGFGTAGGGGNRVALNGVVAPIQNWTDTVVTITVPSLGAVPTLATVKLYSLPSTTTGWSLVATGNGLTVTP
jgi:hypothetical protein